MVVEQEMATIYPPEADDLVEFLPGLDCQACGRATCQEFAEALLARELDPGVICPEMDQRASQILNRMVAMDKSPVPYNIMMEQTPCELIEINDPGPEAPLMVTCNFQVTVQIMTEIFKQSGLPVFLLPTFTHGYSVDNAVHEKMFKAMEIFKAMDQNQMSDRIQNSSLIIPGIAASEKNAIRQLTRWEVVIGPVSGFLAPLFAVQLENGLF